MTPRRSKLDWLKSLRGADLTPAEFCILVLLVSYSNASRENAYPGVARLAEDAGMDKRRVQRILQRLVAKNAIAVTQEGGNQVFKGAATIYKILTPPQRPKGETQFTLQSDKSGSKGGTSVTLKGGTHDTLHGDTHDPQRGDKSGSKGDISSTKGGTSGQGRAVHIPPHQVIHQVNKHHSDSSESGSPATQMSASNAGQDDTNANDQNDDYDLTSIEDELDDELGLDAVERTTVDAVLDLAAWFFV